MITETSILMGVANNLVESQTATNFEIQNYVLPLITIISIFATVFIAYYNAKKNKEITKMTLDATTQNLMIQLNQVQIKNSIKKLSELVRTGNVKSIQDFMSSARGIYIPSGLKKEIKERLYLFSFSWNNVPGNDDERLIMFLNDLDISWVKNAEIRKSEDDRTICIIKDKNSAEIELDEKKEKVALKISDSRTYDLKVKKENGKLNIYQNLIGRLDEKKVNIILDLINKSITPYLDWKVL